MMRLRLLCRYMFGQLCVDEPDELEELPGLVDVDGDALADGEALAAFATAYVLSPAPKASAPASITLAIRLCAQSAICFSPPSVMVDHTCGQHGRRLLSKP